jgi:predicted transcriptional regulator
MKFQITVGSHIPLTPIDDLEEATLIFLSQIGYFPKGYEPRTDARGIRQSVPFRLFHECFLKRMDKVWTIEELAVKLNATKPTIYRHINKLKSLDIVEEGDTSDDEHKKGYRIRYGNLNKAWNFVESHIEIVMENYRKTVEHIQMLAEQEKEGEKRGRKR